MPVFTTSPQLTANWLAMEGEAAGGLLAAFVLTEGAAAQTLDGSTFRRSMLFFLNGGRGRLCLNKACREPISSVTFSFFIGLRTCFLLLAFCLPNAHTLMGAAARGYAFHAPFIGHRFELLSAKQGVVPASYLWCAQTR